MNIPSLLVYFFAVTVQVVGLVVDIGLVKYAEKSISRYCKEETWFLILALLSQVLIPVAFLLHIIL